MKGDGGTINAISYVSIKVEGLKTENSQSLKGGGVLFASGPTTFFKIRESNSTNSFSESDGGAFYLNSVSNIFIEENQIIKSRSNRNGGSIFAGSIGNFQIRNLFAIDSTSGFYGGSLFVNYTYRNSYNVNLNVTNCSFINSESLYGEGGVLSLLKISGGTTSINYCSDVNFLGNIFEDSLTFSSGGSISLFYCENILISSISIKNTTAALEGGAIFFYSCKMVQISNLVIMNSSAQKFGGAIFFDSSDLMYISQLYFEKLFGYVGGATISIFDCTRITISYLVSNESISAVYAGSFNFHNCSEVEMKNIIISSSVGESGGILIFNSSIINMKEILFQNITAAKGGSCLFINTGTNFTKAEKILILNSWNEIEGSLLISNLNSDLEFSTIIFSSTNATKGGSIFLYAKNKRIRFKNILFDFSSAFEGGVLYAFFGNDIYIENTIIYTATAQRGAVVYSQEGNFIFINNSIVLSAQASAQGGLAYSGLKNDIIFKNIQADHLEASFDGGVIYLNESTTLSLNNFYLNLGVSLTGGAFFIRLKSILTINSAFIAKVMSSNFDYELVKMSQSNPSLYLVNCTFKNFDGYFISESGEGCLVNLTNSSIFISKNFSRKEVFIMRSIFGEFSLLNVTIVIENKFLILENFIQIASERSILVISGLNIDYRRINNFLALDKLQANKVYFSLLNMRRYLGTLIIVDTLAMDENASEGSIIYIGQSIFKLSLSKKPFISVKGHLSLLISNTTVQVVEGFNQSIISSVNNKTQNDTRLVLKKVIIDHINEIILRKELNLPSTSPVFGSIKAFNFIQFTNVSIFLNKKNLNSILLFDGGSSLELEKCSFIGNYLNEISHFILIKLERDLQVKISNTKIQGNRVYFGAFLSIEIFSIDRHKKYPDITFSLRNNTIKYNTANQGGFFYVNTSFSEISPRQIYNLNRTIFSLNLSTNQVYKMNAKIGKFLFWEGLNTNSSEAGGLSQSKLSLTYQNYFTYTSIQKLSLSSMDLLKYDSKNSFEINEKIVQNRKKLKYFYFCIAFYDQNSNVLYAESESEINSELKKRGSIVGEMGFNLNNIILSFSFYKGLFCAYKFNFISNYFDLMGKRINITMDLRNLSTASDTLKYISKPLNPPVNIAFEVDQCKMGEFYENSTQVCRPCDRNTFSDNNNISSLIDCDKCPETKNYFCYGADLRSPRKNFWRLNKQSSYFLRCPLATCLGDLDFDKNFTYRDCLNCYLPLSNGEKLIYSYDANLTAIGYCLFGFTGALCAECIAEFGSDLGKKCLDCSNKLIYLKLFLIFILKLLLFFYFNLKAIANRSSFNEKKESEDFVSKIKYSYMLKIMFRHFNYLSLLQILPLELDALIAELFNISNSASPGESFDSFSSECLLKDLGINIPIIYARLIFSFLFFTMALIILLMISVIFLKRQKGEKCFTKLKSIAKGVVIIYVMDNIVAILNSFQSVLFCINIGDRNFQDNRLISSLGVKCYDSRHKYFSYLLSLPVMFVVIVVVPSSLFYKIIVARKRGILKTPKIIEDLGYFIFPYRDSMEFFELFAFLNKLILVGLKPYFITLITQNEEKTAILIMFLYLFPFYIIQIYTSPYKIGTYSILQRVEVYSLLISLLNTMTALIWILNDQREDGIYLFTILMVLFFIFINIFFTILWATAYFAYLKFQAKRISYSLKKVIKFIKPKDKKYSVTQNIPLPHSKKAKAKIISQLQDEIQYLKLQNRLLIERIKNLEKLTLPENFDENPGSRPGISIKGASLPVAQKVLEQDPELFKSQELDSKFVAGTRNPSTTVLERIDSQEVKKFQIKKGENILGLRFESKELKGDCNYSSHISFLYSVSENWRDNINLDSAEVVDNKDWSVVSKFDYDKGAVNILLMKNSKWLNPPHQQTVSIRFSLKSEKYTHSRGELVPALDIQLSLNDFFKIDGIEYDSSYSTSDSKLDDSLSIQLEASVFEKFKTALLEAESGCFVMRTPLGCMECERIKFKILDRGHIKIFKHGYYFDIDTFIRELIVRYVERL